MRLSYPSNVKVVKVPCTGRVDVLLMLKAFESGVDGVYVAGCMEGECHYLRGNLRARRRVEYVKRSAGRSRTGGRAGGDVQHERLAGSAVCAVRAGDDGAGPVARTVAGEENQRGCAMIVGNRKEFGEIVGKLGALRRVLVLGCNECVTVCGVGGEREVGVLASELRLLLAEGRGDLRGKGAHAGAAVRLRVHRFDPCVSRAITT